MILITVSQWLGPSRKAIEEKRLHDTVIMDSKLTTIAFLSKLNLNAALDTLRHYQNAYNAYYKYTAVNFNLLSVCEVTEVSIENSDFFNTMFVEDLDKTFIED